MSKAEKFIEEYTKTCSNVIIDYRVVYNGVPQAIYKEWLTPDDARKAVEIAREEIIEKVVHHIIFSTRTVHYNNYDTREFNKSSLDDIINDLKQAMKDE